MDGWDDRYLAQCQVLVYKNVFWKERKKGAIRSPRRVLPWHEGGSKYLKGTVEEGGWSCLIDHRCSLKNNEFPLPYSFY
jgi:hypothetical protein